MRRAAAVIVLVCVSPLSVWAQRAEFTITSAAAGVHKAPSVASPVIGHAERGAVLEVTRALGSWVRVSWPEAADGVGYLHVSTGSQSGGPAPAGIGGEGGLASQRATTDGVVATAGVVPAETAAGLSHTMYVAPPAHVIGLGARAGWSAFESGISARTWLHDRIGLQFEVSRSALTSPVAPARLTATQFAPSLLLAWHDRMSDDVMVRPYVGGGPRVIRQVVGVGPQGVGSVAESRMAVQVFGGGEVTFPAAPRFTLSADLRYGWSKQAPAGPELDGLGFSLSGHWYVK